MDGVREAEFSFEDASGEVTFDSTRTSVGAVIEELRSMTGFHAEPAGTADSGHGEAH